MMRNNDKQQQLLKIETHLLKVHINCEGCKAKVRKLLRKIEGVYSVEIDLENQMVEVSGCVDSSILINKLVKSGKRAQLCSPLSKYFLKLKQPQPQFLPIDFNPPNHSMLPSPLETFPSPNIRNPQDFMLAKGIRNIYMDENDIYSNEMSSEDEMAYLIDPGKNPDFLGLGRRDFDRMFSYKQNENGNSNMMSGMYKPQPQAMDHAFSMPPPYPMGPKFPTATPSYPW